MFGHCAFKTNPFMKHTLVKHELYETYTCKT